MLLRVASLGGIQPARVWAPPPFWALVLYVGYSQKPLPKRSARQGLTPPADATLVPRQARGEQVARDPGPARTEVGECVSGVCDEERTEVSPLGKACWQVSVR